MVTSIKEGKRKERTRSKSCGAQPPLGFLLLSHPSFTRIASHSLATRFHTRAPHPTRPRMCRRRRQRPSSLSRWRQSASSNATGAPLCVLRRVATSQVEAIASRSSRSQSPAAAALQRRRHISRSSSRCVCRRTVLSSSSRFQSRSPSRCASLFFIAARKIKIAQ